MVISATFAIVVSISIVVWNSTFTKMVYIVFFFLALENVNYKNHSSKNGMTNFFIEHK